MKKGTIYCITNKINGKKYVGQTIRDLTIRFNEHCFDDRSNSKIHQAIKKYGWQNFSYEVVEQVEPEFLDEREQYYIKEWHLQDDKFGYNILSGGQFQKPCKRLIIVENNLIFASVEDFGRMVSDITSWWSSSWIAHKIRQVIEQNKEFLGYHFKYEEMMIESSPIDQLEDWIKTLNVRYIGKHVYCEELDKNFATIAEAAQFLIDNNYSITTSKTPVQSLVTSIGKVINGKQEHINSTIGKLTFVKMPGTLKQTISSQPFSSNKIYCPQLDKEFNSQVEAANYFIDNQIWTGIKLKTAKLRISDVVRGYFKDYKGYTFQKI